MNITNASAPYLDNIGITGAPPEAPSQSQVQTNKRRAYAVSNYRRKNIALSHDLELALEQCPDMPYDDAEAILKFIQNIRGCGSHSLFREFHTGEMSYIGSHTCDSKLCHICNSQRKRKIRKMYYRFFEENPELVQNYDFMHLTLTVPHDETGWRDQRIYITPLLKEFAEMRKKKFWKQQVYAGEYTVEFTRNHNGLHIHIHAMLLVEKGEQNRNRLYRDIFRAWNMQTTWEGAARKEFTDKQRLAIAKALSMSPLSNEFKSYFADLKPTGSTLCSLESLYIMKEGKKKYVGPGNLKDFMAGIMECLKYHFEPCKVKRDPRTGKEYTGGIYETDQGKFNIELLLEVIPAIRGQRLYAKIGKFYGDSRLNINQIDNLGKLIKATEKQFVSSYTFKVQEVDGGTKDSMRRFDQQLEKKGIKEIIDYVEIVEDWFEYTEIGFTSKWENLTKKEVNGFKKHLEDFLWLRMPETESDHKRVVTALGNSFYETAEFSGIAALRTEFKELFGDYYIPYAAMVVKILKENGYLGQDDVSERPHPCAIRHKIREALKAELLALEKAEEAADNSTDEGVVNPETLVPALMMDYQYKIRDIALIVVPREPSTDKDEKPKYGRMRYLGDPKKDNKIFRGKLGQVMRSFSTYINSNVRDEARPNKNKRKIKQAERLEKPLAVG